MPYVINMLTNKKTSNDNDPTNANGKSSTSMATAVNTYFISVAENLLKKIFLQHTTNNDDPMRYL